MRNGVMNGVVMNCDEEWCDQDGDDEWCDE